MSPASSRWCMAMRHGVLPRTLHVDEPSPHVDWSAGRGRAADRGRGRGRRPAGRAGRACRRSGSAAPTRTSSSSRPPAGRRRAEPERRRRTARSVPWLLSGAGPTAALRAQAERLRAHARRAPGRSARRDVGALAGRPAGPRSSTARWWSARTGTSCCAGLDALAAGRAGRGWSRARPAAASRRSCSPGQGAQRLGMGRELYGRVPGVRGGVGRRVCVRWIRIWTGR